MQNGREHIENKWLRVRIKENDMNNAKGTLMKESDGLDSAIALALGLGLRKEI